MILLKVFRFYLSCLPLQFAYYPRQVDPGFVLVSYICCLGHHCIMAVLSRMNVLFTLKSSEDLFVFHGDLLVNILK
jgi:hypothetical protein